MKIILFDLDGTLTDPGEGITACVAYAMGKLGYEAPEPAELKCFVGPPLVDMFMEYCGFTEEKAKLGLKIYREHYKDEGMYQNDIYVGIADMLAALKCKGYRLGVATSKLESTAEAILKMFDIYKYFEYVVGSTPDNSRSHKDEIIEEALRCFGAENDRSIVYMVGDREHDVAGAVKTGVTPVGVLYGYGSRDELASAGAKKIAATVEELREILSAE